MEIMEFVNQYLAPNRTHTRYYGVLLLLMIAVSQIWYKCTKLSICWELLICQLISMATIAIWIGGAPSFFKLTKSLYKAFDGEEYHKLAEKHRQWIRQFSFQDQYETDALTVFKLTYLLIWLLCWIYVAWALFHYQMLPTDFLGISTVVLLGITLILNFSSYYTCIVYTYFLYRVSILKSLKYNKYTPSATEGYQNLRQGAQRESTTFLIVSVLFTISGAIMMCRGLRNWEATSLTDADIFCLSLMVALVLFFGFGTFIVLFLLPKVLLRRMFLFWRSQSLHKFQKALFQAEKDRNQSEVDQISQKIKQLMEDKVGLQFGPIEVLVAITTILVNSVTITNFVIEVLLKT